MRRFFSHLELLIAWSWLFLMGCLACLLLGTTLLLPALLAWWYHNATILAEGYGAGMLVTLPTMWALKVLTKPNKRRR